jgi:HSP20 family protein
MEGFMQRILGGEGGMMSRISQPRINLAETDQVYEVTVDLPGLKPADVHVEYEDGRLIVSGERKDEQEEKGKKYHRVERRWGMFSRTIDLPGAVDAERIEAEFCDGVLRVALPKSQEPRGRSIPIRDPSREPPL